MMNESEMKKEKDINVTRRAEQSDMITSQHISVNSRINGMTVNYVEVGLISIVFGGIHHGNKMNRHNKHTLHCGQNALLHTQKGKRK